MKLYFYVLSRISQYKRGNLHEFINLMLDTESYELRGEIREISSSYERTSSEIWYFHGRWRMVKLYFVKVSMKSWKLFSFYHQQKFVKPFMTWFKLGKNSENYKLRNNSTTFFSCQVESLWYGRWTDECL